MQSIPDRCGPCALVRNSVRPSSPPKAWHRGACNRCRNSMASNRPSGANLHACTLVHGNIVVAQQINGGSVRTSLIAWIRKTPS